MDYYRKTVNKVANDVKLKMQIGALNLKLSENNNKIDDLIGVDKNIKNDISTNTGKINDNENSISNNLKNIDNVTKFISKSEKYFKKRYSIEKQIFNFNKENNFFTIFEEEIEYDFIKNTLLFVQNNIYYKYEDLSDDHHRAQHEYNIYDDENNLIHKYLFNKDTYYNETLDPILYTNEDFCICFKKDYKKIKINLQLHRHNRHGFGEFNLEIDENNDNYINVTCTDDLNSSNISDNSNLISTNTSNISDNSNLIGTNTSNISDNSNLIGTNTSNISSNKGLIETNTSKIKNIENNLIEVDDIYNETFTIQNFTLSDSTALFYYKTINLNFNTNGIIKIDAKFNYLENYNLAHIYRFYSNRKLFKEIKLENTSNVDKFEIQSIDSDSIDIGIHYVNNIDNKIIKLLSNSTIQINYIDNKFKLDMNKNNIASNLTKINNNTSKIDEINEFNKNIKAFYNLDQIFIYDIEKGNQTVNKDNHFHIFEKEITYNLIKNSYLEIALKVLTEISNYVLIGFFQILCNFYDQDDNLFYTISLSTAMGSINKLSTIKSVFIVPINENMDKIKIDFFIAPKETQQNRSARFTIQDINSNKIYVKYFQKTEEMSIKDIQDSLNNVKNISNDLEQIDKNKNDITDNLGKIDTNTSSISSNKGLIETNTSSISNNLRQIDTNKNDITDNLGKINNITKTIMLKNTHFTDFDSTKETIYKEL